jgi:hypothetical protein
MHERKGAYALLSLLLGLATAAAAEPTLVSAADQKRLVMAALPEARQRLPGVEVKAIGADPKYPRLAEYVVTRPGGPGGDIVLGYFDVDPATGDVFQATGCGMASTPALEAMKQDLRRRLGSTPEDYARRRLKGPFCK